MSPPKIAVNVIPTMATVIKISTRENPASETMSWRRNFCSSADGHGRRDLDVLGDDRLGSKRRGSGRERDLCRVGHVDDPAERDRRAAAGVAGDLHRKRVCSRLEGHDALIAAG